MRPSTTPSSGRSVAIIGGGVAGMSAACALAESGFRVHLIERRGYLGGRASSYLHPGVNEVIDNCQHVLFGCCTNLRGFYKRIGVENRIHWTAGMTMIEPGGRRSRLGPTFPPLPAPLHGALSFLTADAFTLGDKLAIGHAIRAMMRPDEFLGSHESLGDWLRRHRQTPGAMNRFWRLVIASALNAEIDDCSVYYAAKVVRELFLNSVEAGSMGMSTVPLRELYSPVADYVASRGGRVSLNTAVDGASWDDAAQSWTVITRSAGEGARSVKSEFVIAALSFEAMGKLLPALPAAPGTAMLAEQIANLVHWPICSVHLWFDREITDLEHAVLLDREIHWLYNQSKLQSRPGNYVELVVSATRVFAALPREAAIDQALRELAEYFPLVRQAKVDKVAFIKEVRATFGVPPGVSANRPDDISPWPKFYLAGDWADTGWPSTMESAARSGHLAAEELGSEAEVPLSCFENDLAPRGLMRFVK
jgi:zeta-carotene desaturase